MKIPSSINIGGYRWQVKIDRKETTGGRFNGDRRIIWLSDEYGDQEETFLHELIEVILFLQNTRHYSNNACEDFKFFFTHTQFTQIVRELFQIMKTNKLI